MTVHVNKIYKEKDQYSIAGYTHTYVIDVFYKMYDDQEKVVRFRYIQNWDSGTYTMDLLDFLEIYEEVA